LEEELEQDAPVTDYIQFVQRNLIQDVFEEFGDLKIRARSNSHCKNAARLVLLAKEETVLKGMTDIRFVIVRCYRTVRNAEKTEVMRISKQSSLIRL